MKKLVAVSMLAVFACLGYAASRTTVRPASAEVAPEWHMTPSERLASSGISGRVGLVRDEIARVASGDEALARKILTIAAAVQALDHDDQELRVAAARDRRLDVALVQSGTAWVVENGNR